MGGVAFVGLVRSTLDLTTPDPTINQPLLQPSQRRWPTRQLLRIGTMYNVSLNPDDFGGALPPLIAEEVTPEAEEKVEIGIIGHGLSVRM